MKKYTDATQWGKMITEAELEAEQTTRTLRDVLDDMARLSKEFMEILERDKR